MQGEALDGAWHAKRRLWRAAGVAVMLAASAAIAAPMAAQVRQAPAVRALAGLTKVAAALPTPMVERLVWQGADVDGDGQPDFANPTGKGVRTTDAYGCGDFGSSRDGGERRHEGVDFRADADQPVAAPISGFVTKIGFAYPGDSTLRFVEISNPALRYEARVFYVDPTVELGQAVHLGQEIGRHHTLEEKYPGGMTDHVHLEIIDRAGERIDAQRLITARMEEVPASQG